jgi:hypothetical protein
MSAPLRRLVRLDQTKTCDRLNRSPDASPRSWAGHLALASAATRGIARYHPQPAARTAQLGQKNPAPLSGRCLAGDRVWRKRCGVELSALLAHVGKSQNRPNIARGSQGDRGVSEECVIYAQSHLLRRNSLAISKADFATISRKPPNSEIRLSDRPPDDVGKASATFPKTPKKKRKHGSRRRSA